MDFNSLLKSRRQTFLFSNKAPEKEKIDSLFQNKSIGKNI